MADTSDFRNGLIIKYKNDLYTIVEYGVRIKSVASSVSENVKYRIEKDTGLVVDRVDVHVRGLRISNSD